MEAHSHIGQSLRSLKSTRRNEAVIICEGRVRNGTQLVDRIAALSIGLRKLGLQSGERVAIAALNSDWYLEWLLAVPSAGGIIAPLNHRWSVEEASEAIWEIQASILVVDDQCMGWSSVLKAACPSLAWTVYIGDSRRFDDTDSLIDAESIIQLAGPEPELQLLHAPQSIALICFTSGTTGRPKGVSLSHNALIVQSLAKISVVGYSFKDVYLHTATLCHIGGISSALATVMANGCHIILPKFQPATVFDSIDRHTVSTMIVVPAMLNDMISYWQNAPRNSDAPGSSRSFPSVATILNGAGSLSSSQLEIVTDIFPASRIMSAYGMTEACSSMTFLLVHDPQPSFRKLDLVKDVLGTPLQHSERWKTFHLGGVCVGKPAPHVEMRIDAQKKQQFDQRMSITSNLTAMGTNEIEAEHSTLAGRKPSAWLPSSKSITLRDDSTPSKELLTVGNVLTRGAHVMDGYWGQPLQTKDALHPDGWLDTGDVGWMDDSGQLWLLGRQKDVIKSGGENVYASEVEGVLAKHPAVLAAATVGLPDTRLGEAVAALVRIRQEWRWDNGETTKEGFLERVITETLLRVHCQQLGLSRYKVPRYIVMQEEPFPITSTGKVKKDQVRSLVIAHLEAGRLAKERASLLSKHSTPDDHQADNQVIIRSRL